MPPVRRRAHYQHVTQFERGRIIGMREAGLSYRAIAHRVGRWLLCYGVVMPGLKKEDISE
jgi:hypothetical protein